MKPMFLITPLWIVAVSMASVVAIPSLPVFAGPFQASPAADTIVTETILLKYMLPSQAVKFFMTPSELLTTDPRIGAKPKSTGKMSAARALPEGIVEMTPKDNDLSLTIKGTRRGIQEATTLLRFLDVKPRQVQVKTRLIEVRLAEDGTKQERLLQAPIISTTNNVSAGVGLSFGNSAQASITTAASEGNTPSTPNTSISVTPHINGDDSISLQVSLTLRSPSTRNTEPLVATTLKHTNKPNEWHAFSPISLSKDKKINESLMAGGEQIPASAYPLYRLEVSANEIIVP